MENIKKIQAALALWNIDAVAVLSPVNRQYATGFPASDGLFFATRDKAYFFTDSRYLEAAEAAIQGAEVLPLSGEQTLTARLKACVADHQVARLGFEEESLSAASYLKYKDALTAELVPAQGLFTRLRAVKEPEELSCILAAQEIAERSLREVLPLLTPDIRETELAAELEYRMRKNGSEGPAFETIVVSGPRSSLPHGVPTDKKLEKGFVTMDFGARVGGYCSDMTRTFALGQPTAEMRRVYETVLAAQEAGMAAFQAGVTGREVDAAAREVIAAAGYGPYFGHAFGHSLGLEIHESPNASPGNREPLPAGAVVTAEPGIYLPGQFGVRIENMVLVEDAGGRSLTGMERQLMVL